MARVNWNEGGGQALARGYRGRGPKNYTRPDARIQEDISERLWDADDVDASDVTVDAKDGEVTLRGNVERRSIKHRIEDIANEIRVQPRNEWPHDKGVAPGNANAPGSRPETVGQGDNTMQSAIENMPPRE